jgi:hypothetical protein
MTNKLLVIKEPNDNFDTLYILSMFAYILQIIES